MPPRRREESVINRSDPDLPPGQHAVDDFPVVSSEPPPRLTPAIWTLTVTGVDGSECRWDWPAFRALPAETFCVDLHSVMGWSKLATNWRGVPLRELWAGVSTAAEYAHIQTYGSYTTSLPLDDLVEMPTWIAFDYEDAPIPVEHGGPARLLIPHLYLWKSAKWVRRISLSNQDNPGTRERDGLHDYGDPWREQRYRDHPTPITSGRARS